MEMPNINTITLKQWIAVSSAIMAILLLAIVFNYGLDNQTDLQRNSEISELQNIKGITNKERFVFWLATVDSNTYNSLDEKGNKLPLCVRHFIVNKLEDLNASFNVESFWFDLPNKSQVEFNRNGKVSCYIPTPNPNVLKYVSDCNEICPGGIKDLRDANVGV